MLKASAASARRPAEAIDSTAASGFVCPLCGSGRRGRTVETRDHEHGTFERVRFACCDACGALVQEPQPTRDDLLRAYPPDYHAYHEYASPLMARVKHRYYVRRAGDYARLVASPRARALDVGCGDGNFLVALREICPEWTLCGVDFKPEIAARGVARGLDVRAGTLEEASFPGGSFDLIVMNHMIEHAFDPLQTLVECRRLLVPGGLVVGETPSLDCWDFDLFGGYWGGLHAPRHTVLFTPKALREAARRAGLEVVAVRHALQPAHIAISLQSWLQARRWTRVRLRNGRAFYYPYLMLALLPLSAWQVLRRRSGVINFLMRHPAAE